MPNTNPRKPYVDRLILAGSASIHTWRYLQGISPYVGEILLVGGGDIPALYRPHNLRAQLQVDFRFLNALYVLPKIRTWLHDQQCFALKTYEQSGGGGAGRLILQLFYIFIKPTVLLGIYCKQQKISIFPAF